MACVQDIIVGLFPARVAAFSRAVAAQKSQLMAYLIAVRLAPVLPSWFVNLAAPILQVCWGFLGAWPAPYMHSILESMSWSRSIQAVAQ